MVPTVSAEILDSTNSNIPVNDANNWAFFLLPEILLSDVSKLFFTLFIKPSTPPLTCMKAMSDPTKNVKITTLVLPASENTFTIPSIDKIRPDKILKFPIISHPENIPIKREITTCLVMIASDIAIIGGIKDRKP